MNRSGTSAGRDEQGRPGSGADRGLLAKALRFGVVGVVSSFFYVGTMAACVDGFGTSATLGAVAAFLVGTAISYVGNTLWSFGAQASPGNAGRFLVVTLAGLGLNLALAWTLETAGLHYLVIALVILMIVPVFNFVCHNAWTYRPAGDASPARSRSA
ncbi:GtrA family protein [Alsobacter sp. SYSU M60028]|uniref:GtrA family protein n=1 Tax=Alsobacter ponti TaxID=2962936 RepID=A0ABT1L6D2_9HYPH|nr:GtrA family protein [Alsobacter ponti]MCP8936947.1 GtrA family protein [Alsobacter ponti]